jgi:tetratricopeptide (TPR) repeat protein
VALGLVFVLIPVRTNLLLPESSKDFVWGLIVVLATGAMASVLYAREAYLGDGTMRAMDTAKGIGFIPSELLPSFAGGLVGSILPVDASVKGYVALRILSVVSAVLLAAALWYLVPRATGSKRRSLLFWILTMGSVRLLAGYIETYTLGFTFFTLWCLASWGYLHCRLSSFWLIVFWTCAMLSHVTAVLLVPATLWLLSLDSTGRINLGRKQLWQGAAWVAVVAGTILLLFYQRQVNLPGVPKSDFFITPLSVPPHEYGLFSPKHLYDLLNHWLLIAPAFLFVGLLALASRVTTSRASVPPSQLGKSFQFWILAGVLPFAAGFLVDPKLGWARDWDLYTLLSAPALVGMALWLDQLEGALRRSAIAIAVIAAGLWLSFSVDGSAEQRRFEALLDLDPSRSDYGHEIMAQQYRRLGDHEGMLRHYRAALAVSENHRYRMNIAAAYFYLNRFDEAERWYRSIIMRDSTNAAAFNGLSLSLSELGRHDEALSSALQAVTLDSKNPDYAFRAGSALMATRQFHDALAYLQISHRARPNDPGITNALAVCYLALDELDLAKNTIELALRLDPDEGMVWLNASRISQRRGEFAQAAKYLQEYQMRVSGAGQNREIKMILDSLDRMTDTSG